MAPDDVTIVPVHSNAARRIFSVRFSPRRSIITTVTRRAATVCSWIRNISRIHSGLRRGGRMVVGLGVQWRPRPGPDPSAVSIIQLSVGSRCLVFHLVHAKSVPSLLGDLLSDRRVLFVGVGIARDCRLLETQRRLTVASPVEIRNLAAKRMGGRRNASMEGMAREVLGCSSAAAVGAAKKQRVGRSNWNVTNLSHDQIIYACVDAQVSYRLGLRLIWGN